MLDCDTVTDYTEFRSKEYGKDYDFFLLPPVDKAAGTPVLVEGHITAMLHDRPEVRALVEWLTTGRAGRARGSSWAATPASRRTRTPSSDWYTNERDRKLAEIAAAAQKSGDLHINAANSA